MVGPRGWRGASRCGVQRLGDELEQRLAGPLDFLGGVQAGRAVSQGVELFEGDARLQKALGPGSDRSFSYGVMTSSWGYSLRHRPSAPLTSTAKRQVR